MSPRPDRPLTRADVMTAADVAELIGASIATVYEWARTGELPCFRRGERFVRFRRWEIEAWLADEIGANR